MHDCAGLVLSSVNNRGGLSEISLRPEELLPRPKARSDVQSNLKLCISAVELVEHYVIYSRWLNPRLLWISVKQFSSLRSCIERVV